MSVLLIGERRFSDHLQTSLSNHNLESFSTVCLKQAADLLKEKFYKVVVCSTTFEKYTYEGLLNYLKKFSPQSNIIFLSEHMGLTKAIELVKDGLYTCLKRPFLIEDLISNIKEAQEFSLIELLPDQKSKPAIVAFGNYVKGNSKKTLEMHNQINLVAPTNFSVIIYGETGTGKESVAERIAAAQDKNAPFVAVDCGCLSKELAASELFGHEKGAFTGAFQSKNGAFEQANRGTLFLDEIGNLDYEIQTYLLRVLQEKKIRKVGGEKEINVKVRIIVASNENLAEKVRKGKFREDLYYRLNEFEIVIPPLRERIDDLHLFIQKFIDDSNFEMNKNISGIEDSAFEIMKSYAWPGNIRELKNTIRRACLLTQNGKLITQKELPAEILNSKLIENVENQMVEFSAEKSSNHFKKIIERAEIDQIMEVLKKVNYNKSKAASLLNIDRKTLYNKLKRFQLSN